MKQNAQPERRNKPHVQWMQPQRKQEEKLERDGVFGRKLCIAIKQKGKRQRESRKAKRRRRRKEKHP